MSTKSRCSTRQPVSRLPRFPTDRFDASPRAYFYGNQSGAVWWTPDGRLRATAGAEQCPTNRSSPHPMAACGNSRQPVDTRPPRARTYRDYPLPNGDAVIVARVPRPSDAQQPGQSTSVTRLFVRQDGHSVHIADVDAGAVAVAPSRP